MSQADTLQDIYSKIADIYDKFCDLGSDPLTSVTNEIVINDNEWTVPTITLENPDSIEAVSTAQSEINELIQIAFTIAQSSESGYLNASTADGGNLVPTPKNSPIKLLVELIKLIVAYRAPLNVVIKLIVDFVKDVIIEIIKRKLSEEKGEYFDVANISATSIIKIPRKAEKIILTCSNLPDWIGKRFEPSNLNKAIITPQPSVTPDLSKYILSGLGSISFGFALTSNQQNNQVFWNTDTKIEYKNQMVDIPLFKGLTGYQRYAYIYLNNQISCTYGFFKQESLINI